MFKIVKMYAPAFIGQRNCEILGHDWVFEERDKEPYTKSSNSKYISYSPLGMVVYAWQQAREIGEIDAFKHIEEDLKHGIAQATVYKQIILKNN